jgi:hypothetical protein
LKVFYPHSTTIFENPLKGIWILQKLAKVMEMKGANFEKCQDMMH